MGPSSGVLTLRPLPDSLPNMGLQAGSNPLTLSLPLCISIQSLNRPVPSLIWQPQAQSLICSGMLSHGGRLCTPLALLLAAWVHEAPPPPPTVGPGGGAGLEDDPGGHFWVHRSCAQQSGAGRVASA